MAVETSTIIAGAACIISGLGMVWTYFGGILSIRKETIAAIDSAKEAMDKNYKSLGSELVKQGNRITTMETKMELFWNAVGGVMSSLIKQPIHFRKDELMDKLVGDKLPGSSTDELLELRIILEDELVTLREIKDPKSLVYALALAYIDQILYDRGIVKDKKTIGEA